MSVDFYTNVQNFGNNILYRGVVDGKRVNRKISYEPRLYIRSKKGSFRTLEGQLLEEKKFENIKAARDYIKGFDGVHGAPKIYGNTRYEYAFIGDEHPKTVEWDRDKILISVIDIEVGSENGFPDPYEATEPITAITIRHIGGKTFVFGCGDFTTDNPDIVYVKCKDEWTLCKRFIMEWERNTPDFITGWNTKFFDIPYLVNRFRRILGDDGAKSLSPWKYIGERNVHSNNRTLVAYDLLGVASLDYLELYKWFAPNGKSQESYRLDNIGNVELGEGKLSFDEFDNLHQLYKHNYQKYIEYNIKDVDLILKLDDKLDLINLALTLAYDSKSNYEDVFAQTRMWDAITYNHLKERNIVVPPREVQDKDSAFEGAYVKDPQVGMHECVASFDLDSLYPHLLMQYSISPENLVERSYINERKRKLLGELAIRNTK